MIKQLPDGRCWIEARFTEEEYQSLIQAACKVGAPDLASLMRYAIECELAEYKGEPRPPMPWKEPCTPALAVRPWHGALSAPMQSTAMPYSPARRYDAESTGTRDRLRQMVAVKRQIELELIDFAEKELMRS